MPKETATLPLLLRQLGLSAIARHWEELNETAQKNHWSYPRYLTALGELEVAARYQRRMQRYLKEAKLPPGKTIATFDFKATKSINAAHIKALAENPSWVKQAENLIIFGPSGVGKSHLAAAVSSSLIMQGIRALFMSTTALVQQLQLAKSNYKLPEALAKLARYPLLILDDIGYVVSTEVKLTHVTG